VPKLGNKCPSREEYHTFESQFCLRECGAERQCVPASVLVHIANKAWTEKHVGDYISVTSLLGCLRELYLERTENWYQEPPTSWYSIRGTLLHTILENPDFRGLVDDMGRYLLRLTKAEMINPKVMRLWLEAEANLLQLANLLPEQYHVPDWESEVEYEMSLGVIDGKERWIHGTLDVIRRAAQEIIDYKTMADKGLPYIGKYGVKPEHEIQFNIYRLLAERGWPVGQRDTYVPFQVKRIKAYYLSMMQIIGTGATMVEQTPWLASEPKTYSSEVSREVLNERDDVVVKRGKRRGSNDPNDYQLSHKTKYRLTYAVPDVRLLDLDEVYKFVVDKATILFRAFDHGEVPPLPSVEMQLWKCDTYCPVKKFCDVICAQRGEERAKVETEKDEIPIEGD